MDDCDEIMTPGLADVSYTSFFNDFDETVTYDKDMFHGRIIDDFSMITIDSSTVDNHESTLVPVLMICRIILGLTQTFTLAK